MLIRNNTVAPQAEYYADSLTQKPGAIHSVFTNLAAGFSAPTVGAQILAGTFDQNPQKESLINSIQTAELENETPNTSWASWGINNLSYMIGSALNPMTWVGAGAGGVVSKGAIGVAEKALPTAANIFMRKPLTELLSEPLANYVPNAVGDLSLGLVGNRAAQGFAIGAGASIPQAAYDNYNQDSKSINWGGVARESGTMGAFGIAIGSIPFAFGMLRGKVNRALGEEPASTVTPEKLTEALENGKITQDEHDWYNDYLSHSANPKENPAEGARLTEAATKILTDNNYSPDTVNHEVQFDILKDTDIESLKGAAADQLVSDLPEPHKTALSDFVVNSRIDELLSQPEKLDGIRGYVDFINDKLKSKSDKLSEADRIIDKHIGSNLKDNAPFSQKILFKYLKDEGLDSENTKRLPIVIPDNVRIRLRKVNKIEELKKRLKSTQNKVKRGAPDLDEEVNNLTRRIDDLNNSLPELLSPKEELNKIRKNLISTKGLPENFSNSKDYHRLLDLIPHWENAKSLLNRIDLEHEYNKQEAFKDLAEHVTNLSDTNLPRLAQISDPLNYLKQRLERNLYKEDPLKNVETVEKRDTEIPADSDELLRQQENMSRETSAEQASKDFMQASEKYNEFKDKDSVFKNLIACVMGATNG